MRTIELTYPHTLLLKEIPETVGAIGFFDGIHKGHQKVIKEAVAKAKKNKQESAIITFHPHPSVVLKQGTEHVQYITPLKEKKEILQKMQVDRLYIITFNKALSKLTPKEFIDHFIIGLHIKHLIAGFDYTFGYKGKGNMENINEFTNDSFTTSIVPKQELDGEKISSTKVRKLLKTGHMKEANYLLGRPLRLSGIVVEGDKRGRTIGFPTANIETVQEALLPKIGVYAVVVIYKNTRYYGMANLGYKPTFNSIISKPVIEVYIFDYNNDLYGEELIVECLSFIREEKKFDGVDSLVTQIKIDEKTIRKFFSDRK